MEAGSWRMETGAGAMRRVVLWRVVIFVLPVFVIGCSADVALYPIEGPLAQRTPLPVVHATAAGITGNSGEISLVTPDGETCNGRWSSAAPQFAAVTSGYLVGTYGGRAGFSATTIGNVPGVNRGEAFIACSGGTTMQAEFFTGSGTANGYGIAKDSRGNVYKMLF